MRCLLIILIIFYYCSAVAKQDDVFTVKNVKVYSNNLDYKAAKQTALKGGEKKGLNELLYRITPYNLHWKLKSLDSDIKIDGMVSGYKIIDTYITSNSYTATVDIMYHKEKINSLLNSIGIGYTDQYSRVNLIIPILSKVDGVKSLWEDDDWHLVWSRKIQNYGLIKLVYALGDLNDLVMVKPDKAIEMPYKQLADMANKYKAEDIIILLAENTNIGTNITIRFVGKYHDYKKYMLFPKKRKEDNITFYTRLIKDITQKIDAQWKGEDLLQDFKVKKDRFYIKFSSIKQWNKIKNKIATIKNIQTVYIIKMNYDNVAVDILFSGKISVLLAELNRHKIKNVQQDGKMILYLDK